MGFFDNPAFWTTVEPHVGARMPRVHRDLRRLTAAISLLTGQNVTVNSGFRDYPIYGYRRGRRVIISSPDRSLHGRGLAVDFNWSTLPGDTNRNRASFVANVARLLGLNNIYITTEGHGTGAHAHVQIGPVGLASINSDYVGFGRSQRTAEYAAEQLALMGITPERIAQMIGQDQTERGRALRELVASIPGQIGQTFMTALNGLGSVLRGPPTLLHHGRLVIADSAHELTEGPTPGSDRPRRGVTRAEWEEFRTLLPFFLTGRNLPANWSTAGRPRILELLGRATGEPGRYTTENYRTLNAGRVATELRDGRRPLVRAEERTGMLLTPSPTPAA